MKFWKGQKVICINTDSKHNCEIEKGGVYTIKKKYKCKVCESNQLILEESLYSIDMMCKCGYGEYRLQSYYEWRFRPYVVS
jgi:hypothetical protein